MKPPQLQQLYLSRDQEGAHHYQARTKVDEDSLTLLSHTVSVSLSLSLISLSPLLTDAQSQQDLPQTPAPHQPSKAKVGAVLREATQKILTRLMTEDPISIGELQQSCNELPPEQTQDILDVHSLCLSLSVSVSVSLSRS
jgi:hypothetical protein